VPTVLHLTCAPVLLPNPDQSAARYGMYETTRMDRPQYRPAGGTARLVTHSNPLSLHPGALDCFEAFPPTLIPVPFRPPFTLATAVINQASVDLFSTGTTVH
jgi:hypothetical protein